ncbi:MAG: hypothetical protein IPP94_17335 [Ignavibacteria bacterium]|nr:hypothetical protein [Ignavibacteria bacterium]
MERLTRTMTREQMTAFRAQVTQRVNSLAPQVVTEQEGRSKFIGTVTTLSSLVYGPLIVEAFDVTPSRRALGVEMLAAGGGFFAPYLLTRNARVTDGMATLALQGGARGVVDGVFLATALGVDGSSEHARFALAFSVAEMLAGYEVARAFDISAGDAALVADLGNFGLGIGCMTAVTIDEQALNGDGVAGKVAGLAGTVAGYGAGALLANSSHYTAGDADMLSTAGVLGAGWPTAILLAFDDGANITNSEYAAGSGLGAIAGLVAGHALQARRDFTQTQGTWIRLSTIAGGLIGLGIGAMILADTREGYRVSCSRA